MAEARTPLDRCHGNSEGHLTARAPQKIANAQSLAQRAAQCCWS